MARRRRDGCISSGLVRSETATRAPTSLENSEFKPAGNVTLDRHMLQESLRKKLKDLGTMKSRSRQWHVMNESAEIAYRLVDVGFFKFAGRHRATRFLLPSLYQRALKIKRSH
jgi:hypothetical protein